MPERLYSAYQVADLLGVTPTEVAQWIQKGWLTIQRFTNGHVRITEHELIRFLKDRGVDLESILAKAVVQEAQQQEMDRLGRPSTDVISEARPIPAIRTSPVGAISQPARLPMLDDEITRDEPRPATPSIRIPDDSVIGKPSPVPAQRASVAEKELQTPAPAPSARTEEPTNGDGFEHVSIEPPAPVKPEVAKTPSLTGDISPEKLADEILSLANGLKAGDIILESHSEGLQLRMRIDGVVHRMDQFAGRLSKESGDSVREHLLTLAGMQGLSGFSTPVGRRNIDIEGHTIGFQLAYLPTAQGWRLTMKLDAVEREPLTLGQLGLDGSQERAIRGLLQRRGAMIVVAGPVGCGKATTMGAIANEAGQMGLETLWLRRGAGFGSTDRGQVIAQGQEYSRAFESVLAQGSDAVLVEDVRQGDILQAGLEAALAGSLVVMSLQVPDASAVLALLLECGLDRWDLSMGLGAIICQRLVRTLCPQCRAEGLPAFDALAKLGLESQGVDFQVYHPQGCLRCGQIGYAGRAGAFSLFHVNEQAAGQLRRGGNSSAILQAGTDKTLLQAGLEKARAGATSLEELAR